MSTRATHAIILAAGRGSRLGALTDAAPKCMVRVAGQALLDWMLLALERAGISSILVVTGYASEALSHYASNGRTLRHHRDWQHTNMVGSLLVAQEWLSSYPCLVTYSDIAVRSDHLARLGAAQGDIVIANNLAWRSLWSERFADPIEDAETFAVQNSQLKTIGGKATHVEQIGGQFMGLLKTTPSGWASLRSVLAQEPSLASTIDTTSLLSRALSSGVRIDVLDCDGGWIEIDSQHDLEVVERGIATEHWPHDWRS